MLPGLAPPAAGSGMFLPAQTVGTVLCCICGVAMQPNPANMCARCIRARVDITEGVPRHAAVVYCPDCSSYLQPPRSWLRAGPESPELLQILLRRLNRPLARLRVSLSGAEFVFSEPHSKRLRVKLRLRREVLHGVVLEQTHPVEFTVHDRLCDACARAQSNPDQWVAVVQLRQHVPHHRTFLYLEQLLLKHGQAALALRVASAPGGLDFFFGSRSHAARLVDFLATVAPVHTSTAKQLVSHDPKSSVYNYKHTFSVEICPICREDLIALSPQASRDLGGLGPLVLCVKVTNAIALLDPLGNSTLGRKPGENIHRFISRCSRPRRPQEGKKTEATMASSCRALALRSLLLPDPLHHLNLRAAASAPAAARSPPRRRSHIRCCSSSTSSSGAGGGGDPGQPPQEAVLEAISKVARSKGRVALTTNMVLGGTVADDSGDEWLVLDQKVNSYPTDRGFTAIGTGGDDFVQSMVVAVESVLQEPIPKGRVSQKLSSRGKYVSVKIGPIRVVSSEQVQAVYRAMRRDNRMKYFL